MILFHLSSFNPLYDKQGQKSSQCLTKEVIFLSCEDFFYQLIIIIIIIITVIIISFSLGLRSIYQPTAAQKGFSLQ